MKAVVNATPLIGLARVERLAVLIHIFDSVLVPPSVYEDSYVVHPQNTGALEIEHASRDTHEQQPLLL